MHGISSQRWAHTFPLVRRGEHLLWLLPSLSPPSAGSSPRNSFVVVLGCFSPVALGLLRFADCSLNLAAKAKGQQPMATRRKLVPLANNPAGLLALLRSAASPQRPYSFPWGFTPNPQPASRTASAARRLAYLRPILWRTALVPPAKSPGRLLAPLRGAAAPGRLYSFSLGFHPKPLARCACPSSAH